MSAREIVVKVQWIIVRLLYAQHARSHLYDFCIYTIIIILPRIIESGLRFRAHGFYDNTLAKNTVPARAPQDIFLFYVYARVRSCTGSETTSPLVYCSPMCPVGEHTAARVLSCFPPQSDSAAPVPSGEITLVHPSPIPVTQQDTSRRRWRWFYPGDVGVSAIKIYKAALPRYVYNRNFVHSLLQCRCSLHGESRTLIIIINCATLYARFS